MPELPEVETVVRDLRPLLTGRTITGIRRSKKQLRRAWETSWNAAVTGTRIEAVRRRGKWILIDLTPQPPSLRGKGEKKAPSPDGGGGWGRGSGFVLRIHLGMTGQFTVVESGEPEPAHLHLVFALDNGTELRFRDPRRFGSAELFTDRESLEAEMNDELGPEPLELDAEQFRESVCRSTRKLKAILLDQTTVAGIGNIYASEICFEAQLHPERIGTSLTREECDRLRDTIRTVIMKAINAKGTDLGDGVYGIGKYEPVIYGRTGEPCPTCKKTSIAHVQLAGRASYLCPTCQTISPRTKSSVKTNGKKR